MNDFFSQFAKGDSEKKALSGGNCVIYTRVSTKEQADTNASLETQKKACEAYARKMGLEVVEYFGGTYESAKTDERKEFNRMLKFVKRSRQRISIIIVYSVDRFSRSGANAIYIADELKKQGIVVQAVTQPADTTTPSGSLQQNIHFIFSQYDNEMRRQKCMAGIRERLLQGYWVTKPPKGYDTLRINGEQKIVVNEIGKKLRQAFLWKANENLTNTEIVARLENLGLKLHRQDITKLFNNPFYCGMMVHKALKGQIVEGRHEKMVSRDLFQKVHRLQQNNSQGYQHFDENREIALKKFMLCDQCSTFLTGYLVKAKKLYYYKCNTKGCGCNHSAKKMHSSFKRILQYYTLSPESYFLAKQQIELTILQLNESHLDRSEALQKQLFAIEKKLERLEERFIEEELSKSLFEKYHAKYLEDQKGLRNQIAQSKINLSNLGDLIPQTLEAASSVKKIWESGDYLTRQKVQKTVFPEGMSFNKKTGQYRTPRVNVIFQLLSQSGQKKGQKNKGQIDDSIDLSHPVPRTGIEVLKPAKPQNFILT